MRQIIILLHAAKNKDQPAIVISSDLKNITSTLKRR